MTTAIPADYRKPTDLPELVMLLMDLGEQDEATQTRWVHRLVEDIKPVIATVRRAAFVRRALQLGAKDAARELGIGVAGLRKTCSEARLQLQVAANMLGAPEGVDMASLMQPGVHYGPLCRHVLAMYDRWDEDQRRRYPDVGVAATLAGHIMRHPTPEALK